jgi:hypothetical protein
MPANHLMKSAANTDPGLSKDDSSTSTHVFPKPPNSKTARPPGFRSHFIVSTTPAGLALHQWNVAEEKTASNFPSSDGSREVWSWTSPLKYWMPSLLALILACLSCCQNYILYP